MHYSSLFAAATLLACAIAGPVPDTHAVHEKRDLSHHLATSKWAKRDRVGKSTVLPMRIGLKQQNLHKGPEWLMSV